MTKTGGWPRFRCRAALDLGVEAVFMDVAPGYKLEKTATGAAENIKRKGTAGGVESASDGRRRGEEEGWVGRLL